MAPVLGSSLPAFPLWPVSLVGLAIFAEREVKVLSAATHSLCIPFLTKGSSKPGTWRAGPRGQLWRGQWPCLPCAGEGRCKEGVFRLEPAGGRGRGAPRRELAQAWEVSEGRREQLCEQRAEGALLEAGQPFRPLPPHFQHQQSPPTCLPIRSSVPTCWAGRRVERVWILSSGVGGDPPRYVLSTEGAGRGPEGP